MTDNPESLRKILMALGVTLVVMGGVLLLYMAVTVFRIMEDPGSVTIVQFILGHVNTDPRAVYGEMVSRATGQAVDFEVALSDSVRTLSFLFLGALILGILAKILHVLMSVGIKIIKMARGEDRVSSN